jgi:hypothetical protein
MTEADPDAIGPDGTVRLRCYLPTVIIPAGLRLIIWFLWIELHCCRLPQASGADLGAVFPVANPTDQVAAADVHGLRRPRVASGAVLPSPFG